MFVQYNGQKFTEFQERPRKKVADYGSKPVVNEMVKREVVVGASFPRQKAFEKFYCTQTFGYTRKMS